MQFKNFIQFKDAPKTSPYRLGVVPGTKLATLDPIMMAGSSVEVVQNFTVNAVFEIGLY